MTKRLLDMQEVATVLGVSRDQAYNMARNGILPVVRMGRLMRVDPDRLEEWIGNGGQQFDGGWKKQSAAN